MADVLDELEQLPAKQPTLQDFLDDLDGVQLGRFRAVLLKVKAEDVARTLRAKGYKVSARSVLEAKARLA